MMNWQKFFHKDSFEWKNLLGFVMKHFKTIKTLENIKREKKRVNPKVYPKLSTQRERTNMH